MEHRNKVIKIKKYNFNTDELFNTDREYTNKTNSPYMPQSYMSRIKPAKNPFSSISYSLKTINVDLPQDGLNGSPLKIRKINLTKKNKHNEIIKQKIILPVLESDTMSGNKNDFYVTASVSGNEISNISNSTKTLNKLFNKVNVGKFETIFNSKNFDNNISNNRSVQMRRFKTDHAINLIKPPVNILYSKGNTLVCKILGREKDFYFHKITTVSNIFSF
jgi:hypothetical protein